MTEEIKEKTILIDKIIDYLDMKIKRGIKENSVKQYRSLLSKLTKFKFIEDITEDDLNDFIYGDEFADYEIKKGDKSYIARRHYFIIIVGDFLGYNKKNNLVDWLEKIRIYYKEDSPKPVDDDVIKAKLKSLDDVPEEELSNIEKENLKFAVLFMVNTGLRSNEFLSLQIKDILKEDKINVLSKGEEEKEPLVLNKTATELLHKHIGYITDKEVYIFNLSKDKFSYWFFWDMFKKFLGFCPHRLRHTFCYKLDKMGMTPTEIQTMARHERFDTTRKYINPEKEKIEAEFRKKVESVI